MSITLTRFNRTPSGYRRLDVHDLEVGDELADTLTATSEVISDTDQLPTQAWSFGKFNSGKMSGETWRSGSAIILEYYLDCKETPVHEERLTQIVNGANRTGLGYMIANTMTRYKEETITLVFPLTCPTDKPARYIRMVSVLASQVDCYEAPPGIQAHTHLIHCHRDTSWMWVEGQQIDPLGFIKQTAEQAQRLDPAQFERRRPAAQPSTPPANLAVEDGLFSW